MKLITITRDEVCECLQDYLDVYGPWISSEQKECVNCLVTKWENDKYILRYYDYGCGGFTELYKKELSIIPYDGDDGED